MSEWNQEAYEYLDGYLKQVSALAKRQGDDDEEIVSGLRDHIAHEVVANDEGQIDLDSLLVALSVIGSPEDVLSAEHPINQPEKAGTLSSGEAQVIHQSIVKKRSGIGCVIALFLAFLLGLLVLGVVSNVASIAFMSYKSEQENNRYAECKTNLEQIGLALQSYAARHDGAYPPLASQTGRLMFEYDVFTASNLENSTVFLCPADDDVIKRTETKDFVRGYVDDHSYYYLSLAIHDEQEGLDFVEAYRVGVIGYRKNRTPYMGKGFYRMDEISAEDASRIPVMIEKPGHHATEGGGNVLFLDGHVEYILLDEKFPMTTKFLDALHSIGEDDSNSTSNKITTGKMVIESIAIVDFEDSPLHQAAKEGHVGEVERLAGLGVDINSRDEFGKTALHYAAEFGHNGTVKLLVEKGADTTIRDKEDRVAYQYAVANGHEETGEAFRKKVSN